ncbi:MAG: 4Fe-4S double cluster binding domain-containing protein [Candidatus Hodarchaeota archaeon]
MVRNRNGLAKEIMASLEAKGYRACIVSAQQIDDLRVDFEKHYQQNMFDPEFYQERLARFKFDPYDILPEVNSAIIVAVPQPQIRVTFAWQKKRVPLIVPPTYLFGQETDKAVEDFMKAFLMLKGYQIVRAVLPLKLLAAYSGLAKYGKNNISYVSEMGSFHRLVAFYSDLPSEGDKWQKPQVLDSCATCFACLRKCPTGAITSERFLLHAERCLTFLNEKPGNIPFPNWVDQSWHNCLVGCLHCQKACPENKKFLQWVDQGVEFSEEETGMFLKGVALNQLPAPTRTRLKNYDLLDYLDLFPRNLGVFFKAELE